MPVQNVKLYICDGCKSQIIQPRGGLFMVLSEEAKWVGGFPEYGSPATGDLTDVKIRTPKKGEGPFYGVEGTLESGRRTYNVTMCRKCLAARLGFTPDSEVPDEEVPKKPPPTDRFGHEDPV